jgi:hypothetical protein
LLVKRVTRDVGQRRGADDRRVVDQHIDATELAAHGLHDGFGSPPIADPDHPRSISATPPR